MDPIIKPWWELPEKSDEAGRAMVSLFRVLETLNAGRSNANLRHLRLYNNQEINGLSVSNYVHSTQPSASIKQNRLTLNVIKSCIDTLVSKLCKTKIKPSFLTSGGSWVQQRRAMKMNRFMTGLFYKTQVNATAPMCLREAFIFGDGHCKVFTDPVSKSLKAERVFADEIVVDPNDAYYGKPRIKYQKKYVSKSELMAQYPDKKDVIMRSRTESTFRGQSLTECVLVVEAWVNATKKGKKDGRHMLAVDGGNLFDEVYTRDKSPIATMRYTEQVLGFYGMGVAEELIGIQVEINRILAHITQCMRLIANPRVFIESASNVNQNQLTNEIGGIVEYTGTPPVFQIIQSVAPEYFQQLQNLYVKAYEIVGVSAMSAQSKNPLGSKASGRALREMSDIESERFMLTGQMYENFHLDITDLMCEEICTNSLNIEVKSFNRRDGLEVIESSECDFSKDDYVIQIFPISALPDTPAARLQTITEFINAGYIDPEDGLELLDFPDLDNRNKLYNSPLRLIRMTVEKILDEGVVILPDPYDNIDKAKVIATMYYNYARLYNVERNKLDALRDYIDAIDSMIMDRERAAAGQTQAPMAQAALPAQQLVESQLAATPESQISPQAVIPQV